MMLENSEKALLKGLFRCIFLVTASDESEPTGEALILCMSRKPG